MTGSPSPAADYEGTAPPYGAVPLGGLSRRRLTGVIAALALPVVLANISQTLMGLVDTLMVGRLGSAQLAAVGVATLLFSAMATTLKAVDVAVQTETALRVGSGRDDEVGGVAGTAAVLVLVTGGIVSLAALTDPAALMSLVTADRDVLAFGAEYLRWRLPGMIPFMLFFVLRAAFDGIGWTRIGMLVGIGMNGVNVVLNGMFIFGWFGAPAMGVGGAALASTLSSLLAVVVLLGIALSGQVRHRFGFYGRGSWRPRLLPVLLRLAWPAAVQSLGALLAVLVFFRILGLISMVAVAAGNIVLRIAALSFMPGFGVGVAVQTLVGQSLGRGDSRGARRAGWGGVGLAMLVMGVFGVVFLLVPQWLMRLFAADPALIAAGTPILRLMGLVQIFDAVGLTLAGALRGAGQTRQVMIVDIVAAWLLFLPTAWLFGVRLRLGLTGAWVGVIVWFFLYAVGMAGWFVRGDWPRGGASSLGEVERA